MAEALFNRWRARLILNSNPHPDSSLEAFYSILIPFPNRKEGSMANDPLLQGAARAHKANLRRTSGKTHYNHIVALVYRFSKQGRANK
jgi:hypothetical protein